MEKSKVAVVACPDYEPARVKESLQKGLEAIGGLESLIGKEENILLKPNLVRSAKRERAVVTDPEVMDALITILRKMAMRIFPAAIPAALVPRRALQRKPG